MTAEALHPAETWCSMCLLPPLPGSSLVILPSAHLIGHNITSTPLLVLSMQCSIILICTLKDLCSTRDFTCWGWSASTRRMPLCNFLINLAFSAIPSIALVVRKEGAPSVPVMNRNCSWGKFSHSDWECNPECPALAGSLPWKLQTPQPWGWGRADTCPGLGPAKKCTSKLSELRDLHDLRSYPMLVPVYL